MKGIARKPCGAGRKKMQVRGAAQVEDASRFEAQPGFARTEEGSWNLGARIRQTVYRGLRRVDQHFKLTMAASNLVRMARMLGAVPQGVAR